MKVADGLCWSTPHDRLPPPSPSFATQRHFTWRTTHSLETLSSHGFWGAPSPGSAPASLAAPSPHLAPGLPEPPAFPSNHAPGPVPLTSGPSAPTVPGLLQKPGDSEPARRPRSLDSGRGAGEASATAVWSRAVWLGPRRFHSPANTPHSVDLSAHPAWRSGGRLPPPSPVRGLQPPVWGKWSLHPERTQGSALSFLRPTFSHRPRQPRL